jgi:hypothetical protein
LHRAHEQSQLALAGESAAATAAQQHRQTLAYFSKVKATESQHAAAAVINATATGGTTAGPATAAATAAADTTAAGLATAAATADVNEDLKDQALHARSTLDSVPDLNIINDACRSDNASSSDSEADSNDSASDADATHSTALASSSNDSSSNSSSGHDCSTAVNAQSSSEHSSLQQKQELQRVATTSRAAVADSATADSGDVRVMRLATAAHTVTAIFAVRKQAAAAAEVRRIESTPGKSTIYTTSKCSLQHVVHISRHLVLTSSV